MVRKWFNIKSKTEDFQADDVVYGGEGESLFLFSFPMVSNMFGYVII